MIVMREREIVREAEEAARERGKTYKRKKNFRGEESVTEKNEETFREHTQKID